jgi:hypothetical protein
MAGLNHPVTPDGRYFVVGGKLWRMRDPSLAPDDKARLVKELMDARRAVKAAKAGADAKAEATAHRRVDEAKRGLGERGPVWWDDGAPDFNRYAARSTPYAAWYGKTKRQASGHPGAGEELLSRTAAVISLQS